MQIETVNERVACSATPARVVIFDPGIMQSLTIQNLGPNTVELGKQGTVYGAGYPLALGDVLSISWEDFSPEVRALHSHIEIWGICTGAETGSLQVYGFAAR